MRGLSKSFGDVRALDGVDLDVAPGHGDRPARPQRRRQDDRGARHGDAAGARCRRGVGRRAGRRQGCGQGARADRPRRTVRGDRREPHGPGEPRHGRPPVRDEPRRGDRARARAAGPLRARPRRRDGRPRRTPAACGAGWTSGRRSSPSRRCSSSTSRRRAWIRAAASKSGRRSRSSSPRVAPCC